MRITSGIGPTTLIALMLVGLSCPAQEAVSPSTAVGSNETTAAEPIQTAPASSGYSKVRIVRLSEVKGEVKLDRNVGRGFETPMTNLPITEGARLKTTEGAAEIELEDNSTIRVGPNSLVEFPRLEMLPSGAKTSAVNVLQGTVYVSLMNTKGNEFTLGFGAEKLNLPPDTHVRLQLTSSQANLAVLHGDVVVQQPAGITTVGKNKTMTFNLVDDSQPTVAKNVAEQPLDSWDHDATQYHKNFANATSFGNSPYSYGLNDMNYYGSYVNGSGCGGSMWRPYFTSASWDPYGSGAWAYYPSAGYSWVSPYPWAWTPYHYGSWSYCNGVGWGWRPGGTWMGLANNSFASSPTRPKPPTHAPVRSEASLVPVNIRAIPASSLGAHDTFVFRSNSAGFGVPRGSLGKLNSFSSQTVSHGMASTSVYYGGGRGSEGGAARSESAGSYSGYTGQASSQSASSNTSYAGASQGAAAAGGSRGGGGASGGGGGGRH